MKHWILGLTAIALLSTTAFAYEGMSLSLFSISWTVTAVGDVTDQDGNDTGDSIYLLENGGGFMVVRGPTINYQ